MILSQWNVLIIASSITAHVVQSDCSFISDQNLLIQHHLIEPL
jgi:hypothetical protein